MKQSFWFVIFIIFYNNVFAQCPDPGQNPISSRPACGSAVYNRPTVTPCPGRPVVTLCNDGASYTDVNPYYYKFRCYKSGPLEFLLTPKTIQEDYDWQVYDVTGKNVNNIYTDASMIISYNWSGKSGPTGTSITATVQNGCAGNSPLVVKAPNLIIGHDYVLMVSNFSNTINGYNLTFGDSTAAAITDTTKPRISKVYSNCNSNQLRVKLTKKILCESIEPNGSDFEILGLSPLSASGIGCGTDTDSLLVTFSNVITTFGILNIKTGTDGNSLIDECNNTVNSSLAYSPSNSPDANFSYSFKGQNCDTDTLLFSHDGNTNVNYWSWSFDGIPTTSSNQSQQVIFNNQSSRNVKLIVANPQCTTTITKNIPVTDKKVLPKIVLTRDTSCPNIPQNFSDASQSNTVSWNWDFGNGQTSTLKNPPSPQYPVLPINKIYTTKMIAINNFGCKDSTSKDIFIRGTIPTEFDSIIPTSCDANKVQIYFKQDMVCTSVANDGSDFIITGPSIVNITSASINCTGTVGTIVTLNLANKLMNGVYSISIKKGTDGNAVINDCGIETLPKTLTFKSFASGLYANLKVNINWGCKVDTVQFTIDTIALKNWQWSFNEGLPNIPTSTAYNPTVLYTYMSTDTISRIAILTYSYGNDCVETNQIQYGVPDHYIKADFVAPDTTCGLGSTIFIDKSYQTNILSNSIKNWWWNFGFGNATSTLQNPLPVNYPLVGTFKTYNVSLIIKNFVGCFDTIPKQIVVRPSAPSRIKKLNYNICGADSILVEFDYPLQCNTIAADGSDFKFSGPSFIQIANAKSINCVAGFSNTVVIKLAFPISFNGQYSLVLKRGIDGNSVINSCNIESPFDSLGFVAYAKVNAAFTTTDVYTCTKNTINFNHTRANEVTKWAWFVNGSLINSSPTFSMIYDYNHTKYVKLIVSNGLCADTSNQTFNLIFDKIKADFVISNNIVCPGDLVSFTNKSIGNLIKYEWDFGDGDKSFIRDITNKKYLELKDSINPVTGIPVTTSDNNKFYKVSLKITNSTFCTESIVKELKLASSCIITVPTAFTPNGDGLNDNLFPLNAHKALDMTFNVYNRSGKLIFTSNSSDSRWLGTNYFKERQPAGTYVWTLEYTNKDTGEKIFKKGTTILIR